MLGHRTHNQIMRRNSVAIKKNSALFGPIENLKVFFQNDLKTEFHRIKMKSEDNDEKPFTKMYSQLECLLMQFET